MLGKPAGITLNVILENVIVKSLKNPPRLVSIRRERAYLETIAQRISSVSPKIVIPEK